MHWMTCTMKPSLKSALLCGVIWCICDRQTDGETQRTLVTIVCISCIQCSPIISGTRKQQTFGLFVWCLTLWLLDSSVLFGLCIRIDGFMNLFEFLIHYSTDRLTNLCLCTVSFARHTWRSHWLALALLKWSSLLTMARCFHLLVEITRQQPKFALLTANSKHDYTEY